MMISLQSSQNSNDQKVLQFWSKLNCLLNFTPFITSTTEATDIQQHEGRIPISSSEMVSFYYENCK